MTPTPFKYLLNKHQTRPGAGFFISRCRVFVAGASAAGADDADPADMALFANSRLHLYTHRTAILQNKDMQNIAQK
ncbi:hypothetical protein HNR62_001464 [Oceanisphaera litoralis]|uniref:hypothetical protein n=1 Tax=Oceanisphaera litoralis TaxID=225144 RepID=UPI00195B2BD4|nr:hypothetical protein [Oceanisphaera litoralis]MBM7455592.1 hypothetical protein [Oceanisphaera litoralis]